MELELLLPLFTAALLVVGGESIWRSCKAAEEFVSDVSDDTCESDDRTSGRIG